jgi:polyisoprenoid-binding protein YceI
VTHRTRVVGGLLTAVVALAAGFMTWFFVIRKDGPSAATSQQAVDAVKSKGASSGTASAADVSGTWTVDTKAGAGPYPFDKSSYVGYRIVEELGGIGANTAVGRTPAVTGSLTIDRAQIASGLINADFKSLQSDSSSRDRSLRDQSLQTDKFPSASFKITRPIDLGSVPAEGKTITVKAEGDLTLHGVTKPIVVSLEATLVGNTIAVIGRAPVTFAEYNIERPTAAVVVSVKDAGELEFQLFFTR